METLIGKVSEKMQDLGYNAFSGPTAILYISALVGSAIYYFWTGEPSFLFDLDRELGIPYDYHLYALLITIIPVYIKFRKESSKELAEYEKYGTRTAYFIQKYKDEERRTGCTYVKGKKIELTDSELREREFEKRRMNI